MANAEKLLTRVRQSFTLVRASSKSLSSIRSWQPCSVCAEFEPLKAWRASVGSLLRRNIARPPYTLGLQRKYIHNFSIAGSKAVAGILMVPVISRLICFRPNVVYAMDGQDVSSDDFHTDFWASLCCKLMDQKPHLYLCKTLYAHKVEVQDYKLLCLARVEVADQKLHFVGILGDWWELPTSQAMFTTLRALLRNKGIDLS